jgi:predicted kinase
MAILHLMVGLPCSGKTTAAQKLETQYNALVLTPDKWQIKLFGNDTMEKEHDTRHSIVESIMWEMAERVLLLGVDVILDFGFWAKEERDHFRAEAKRLGVGFMIHYMNVNEEELFERLNNRNNNLPDGAFSIPIEKMKEYIPIFQPPGQEELSRR